MPKFVVSSTLTDPEWHNTTVLEGDVVEAVKELKGEDGGSILVAGSCTLVHTLIEQGLVDELRLMVFPVAVGGSKRVFADNSEKAEFALEDTQSFPSGVTVPTYHLAA